MGKNKMDGKFSKRAFDIDDLPDNIDLDSPPVTGFDYLYRVRLESKKCPKVVVSNIDTAQFIRHQTVSVDFCNGFIKALPGFEPNIQWQDGQVNLFTRTRDELQTHRISLRNKHPKREFPKFPYKEDWCIYCLGKEKYYLIYNVKPKDNTEEICGPQRKKLRFMDERHPPLLSIILYLSQNDIIKLISYHVDWLKKTTFCHEQGEWLYALLLCLEKPLDPNTCALLRSLSRVCSNLRSDLSDPQDEALKPLNILMTIVSHYFDQKDMSDNFLIE